MTGSVSHTAAPVGLPTLTVIKAASSKCPLIDLTIVQPTEWHSIVLQLKYKIIDTFSALPGTGNTLYLTEIKVIDYISSVESTEKGKLFIMRTSQERLGKG